MPRFSGFLLPLLIVRDFCGILVETDSIMSMAFGCGAAAGDPLVVGHVGCVNGDAPRVLEVLFFYSSAFIFGLGDVQVDDALILHLCHILGKCFGGAALS